MSVRLHTIWSRLRESGLISLLLLVLIVFSFRSAIADWNDVPTGSMRPTIMIGDRIFVNKVAYDLKIPFTEIRLATWSHPDRGDIVTCWSPQNGNRLVKRIVAIPGDAIAMKNGVLIINGQPLTYSPTTAEESESIAGRVFHTENLQGTIHIVAHDPNKRGHRNFEEIVLGDNKYFLMGDNRDNSADSRYFGLVDRSAICGEVIGLAFSLDHDNHYLPRRDRFFAALE